MSQPSHAGSRASYTWRWDEAGGGRARRLTFDRSLLAAALGFALVGVLAADSGGYWPMTWGWSSLVLLWIGALGLILGPYRLAPSEWTMLAALGLLLIWVLLSAAWDAPATATVREAQRLVVYLAGTAATLLVVRRGSYRALLGGVWAAVVVICVYSLVTRLVPDRFGVFDPIAGYRLSVPIEYWNALGIFAAMGTLLGLGLAARAHGFAMRFLAAGSVVVLLSTLYFTYSRGAWVALAIGMFAFVAFDSRRLQSVTTALAVAPWAAAGLWIASRSDALTRVDADLAMASREGHRLAIVLSGLILGAGASVLAVALLGRSFVFSRPVRVVYGCTLATVFIAGLVAVFVEFGSPPTLARKAHNSLTSTPPAVNADLNQRLLTLASGARIRQWRVAWRVVEEHPWLGAGAGSYERWWNQYRTVDSQVRDAHSLYLEMLAELGPIGLGLLTVALGTPLVVVRRVRRRSLGAGALGAYVAFLVHAGVDWDWEMPAVTLSALFIGSSLLVAAQRERDGEELSLRAKLPLLAVAFLLGVFAFAGLVANRALEDSRGAAGEQDWPRALAEARKVTRWAPWSAQGWIWVGNAQLAMRDEAAARRSYLRALEKDRENAELWRNIAVLSEGEERRVMARRALELDPFGAVGLEEFLERDG
jgi:O-antigen ligase